MVPGRGTEMSVDAPPRIFIHKHTRMYMYSHSMHISEYIQNGTVVKLCVCVCVYWTPPDFIYVRGCFTLELAAASEQSVKEA